MTKTLPISEVKMKLTALVKGATQCDDEIVITRNGRPAAVILSYSHYESLQATIEVLSDEELMRDIRVAQQEIAAGAEGVPMEDVFRNDPDASDNTDEHSGEEIA